MELQEKRQQLATEIFAATGVKVDGYDPLVIAALFYSDRLRAAGDDVARQLETAAKELRDTSHVATTANAALLAERTKLFKDIEAHVAWCVNQAATAQSKSVDFRYVPIWHAVVGAFAVGLVMAAAVVFGLERGSAQADEAAIGRSFLRVVPELEPKVRKKIMEHLRKKTG